jgi:Clp amino terminal domain, pathogenicity island component
VFEQYTEKARRVIFFARSEAGQFGSPYIESEHLLLGLLRESKALSARLFVSSPTSVDKIRKQVEMHRPHGEKIPTSVDLPISEECQRILHYASEEADTLSHKHIGTEHLLLGILRVKDCYGAQLLNENGVTVEDARSQISQTTREEVASPARTSGIPAGYTLQRLLYNPASETIVVEMKCPPDRPLPALGRLFMRSRQAEGYEQIGDPAADVSYQTSVTCEKQPIVIFNTIKWDRAGGGGNSDGVYAFNLLTKKLMVCCAKDKLAVPVPHLRSWILTLISLSDDGEALYVNVGIETAVPSGGIVHYYLARLNLTDNKLELLSPLKDIHF